MDNGPDNYSNETLNHVAIIMDGNGRWAEKKGMLRNKGHMEGVDSLKDVVKSAIKLKIQHLTVFAFSTENWVRPESEVSFLFELMKRSIENNLSKLKEQSIRLRFIGDLTKIPAFLQSIIKLAEKETSNCDKLTLNVAINYGGRWDVVTACKKVASDYKSNRLDLDDITEEVFNNYMSLGDAPALDLFIRTSGEQRVSNFLLWYLNYAEIYFTDKYWPDFKGKDMEDAANWFFDRERRFGAIGGSALRK